MRTAIALGALVCLVSLGAYAAAPAEALADLAPGGALRAAINFGNPVLASRDPSSGEPRGVSVDLSRELARELGVRVELVTFDAAGKVVDALRSNAWDVAFLAIDPKRATDIAYSAPYVLIEGVYMVPATSSIRAHADVDRPGVRVVVATGSAYDLYLSRELHRATLVRVATSQVVADALVARELDVAAGVRQQLESDARRISGMRILDGRFMAIEQAMGTPRARATGAAYLRDFVERMKASGFVARSLATNRIEGAAVAPPAPR